MIQNAINHEIVQGYLENLYRASNGYVKYSPEQRQHYLSQDVCITYGEVYYLSLLSFAEQIQLGPQDVFLDLGSGLGKICTSILLGTSCQRVLGIEASEVLHEQAVSVLPKLQTLTEAQHKNIKLIHGNFLSAEVLTDIKQATVVFINSTAFTYELLDKIALVLNQCPSIRAILTFKPFANLALPFNRTLTIEASWDSILARLYTKAAAHKTL